MGKDAKRNKTNEDEDSYPNYFTDEIKIEVITIDSKGKEQKQSLDLNNLDNSNIAKNTIILTGDAAREFIEKCKNDKNLDSKGRYEVAQNLAQEHPQNSFIYDGNNKEQLQSFLLKHMCNEMAADLEKRARNELAKNENEKKTSAIKLGMEDYRKSKNDLNTRYAKKFADLSAPEKDLNLKEFNKLKLEYLEARNKLRNDILNGNVKTSDNFKERINKVSNIISKMEKKPQGKEM